MSAKWPTSVAADADLYVAVNSLQTTLSTALGTSDTSVVLASATGFPTAGGVTIGNEVIFYTGVSGATLTGCTRGADGTTAASHSVGVPVGAAIIAFHHNGLMAEIEAIESSLNLTANRAVATNASGRVVAATTTDTELGYVHGVTSAIQTQLGLLAPLASPTFTGTVTVPALTATNTTNQLILSGPTRTLTISAPQPATSSRIWTIPDVASDATFAALEGTQTFSGSKTFSAAVAITATSNHLSLSTSSNKAIISASTQATSDRTFSIPDISGNGTFAFLEGTQTFSGNKTFSGTVSIANTKYQIGGNQAYPIVQIVTGSTTTQATSTSASYADTNLTASITPKFATSKIIVIIAQNIGASAASTSASIRVLRDSSALSPFNGDTFGWYSTGGEGYTTASFQVYDTPGDTSAHTYKTQFSRFSGSGTVKVQTNQSSTLTSGSFITLIEVAQ